MRYTKEEIEAIHEMDVLDSLSREDQKIFIAIEKKNNSRHDFLSGLMLVSAILLFIQATIVDSLFNLFIVLGILILGVWLEDVLSKKNKALRIEFLKRRGRKRRRN